MDSNAREPVSPGGGVGLADRPTNPVSGVVPEPSVAAPSPSVGSDMSSDLSDLQKLVNAAKEQVPTDSEKAFVSQFGSVVTPPVAEAPSSSVASLDPSINTVADLLAKGPQVVENPNPTAEAASQPEEDPQATFVQDIKNAVDKLEQATKEKTAA